MKKKILNKDQILRAMKYTKSNMAAARFLGCSYPHYKQYAKLYKNEEGKTLFEVHYLVFFWNYNLRGSLFSINFLSTW